MTSAGKERAAVVVIALLLLWAQGLTLPHVAAAIVAVVFFWWFVGWCNTQQCADDSLPPVGDRER